MTPFEYEDMIDEPFLGKFMGLTYISITLVCIVLCWWALQAFRFDVLLRDPKGFKAQVLQMIIAIVLGFQFVTFIFQYLQWSLQLKWMFS